MKKSMAILSAVALMVAGASADLGVSFSNSDLFIANVGTDTGTDFDPASYLSDGSIAQLIWSADAPAGAMPGVDVGGTMLAGEFLLSTINLNTLAYGAWGPGPGLTYTSADVGGADINAGYIYARVFEGVGAANEYYYTSTKVIDTANWVLVGTDPSTVYSASVPEAGIINIDAQGTQVVPEPATIGLMGIAGLGMFLARRKTRR
jgi:hypothetical protein